MLILIYEADDTFFLNSGSNSLFSKHDCKI